jgi:hypothetical protein
LGDVIIGSSDPNAFHTSPVDKSTRDSIEQEQRTATNVETAQLVSAITSMFGSAAPVPLAATPSAGAGYSFSPAHVQQLIDQLTDKGHRLRDYLKTVQTVDYTDFAPARDQAGSVMHARALTKSFGDVQAATIRAQQNVQTWVDALTAAKQKYMEQESLTEQQWHRLTLGLGG